MQRLNVRISPLCPLDVRSEETYGCISLVVAGLCIGPKAHCLIWEFYPYNNPSKFRFFPSYPRRKGGILTFIGSFVVNSCFTHAEACPPRASLLLKAFRNPRGANYCAWRLYVLPIQRWGARSTVDILSISLGGSKPVQLLQGI